jgi:RNA polymerase-binding protein DksA
VAKRTTQSKKTAKKRTAKKSATPAKASSSTTRGKKATTKAKKKTTNKSTKKTTKKVAKKTTRKATTKKSPARTTAVKETTKKATRKPQAARQKVGSNGDEAGQAPPKVIRTRLSDKDLNEFRELLLAKRRELAGDVLHLENEAREHNSNGGNSSPMPLHMADLGSDTWEQELTLGLIEAERSLLREIDEALDRIDNRTYGVCLGTGKPIAKVRLRAQPWAKYCIEYARKRELGLV